MSDAYGLLVLRPQTSGLSLIPKIISLSARSSADRKISLKRKEVFSNVTAPYRFIIFGCFCLIDNFSLFPSWDSQLVKVVENIVCFSLRSFFSLFSKANRSLDVSLQSQPKKLQKKKAEYIQVSTMFERDLPDTTCYN